jgi:lysophospholipase L1-like esterase
MLGRRRSLACVLAVACWATSAAPAVAQQPTHAEEMGWSVLSRYGGDANGDGRLDPPEPRRFADLDVFPVLVRPPEKLCAAGPRTGWFIDGQPRGGIELKGGKFECHAEVGVRGEGEHKVELRAGATAAVADVKVNDSLVLALGDSVASGEGNPEEGKHRWLDVPCHRSAVAGFQQAATLVAQGLIHRSLTFVNLACSGAEIEEGLLGPYAGVAPDKRIGEYEPQVTRLQRIDHAHSGKSGEIDAVLLSVGANDVHFSEIVKACAINPFCRSKAREARLSSDLATLETHYDLLGKELRSAAPSAPVLISEYFDPTRDEEGEFCGLSLGLTTRSTMRWAYETLLVPLNTEISEAAARNRWRLIGGIAKDFERHGYCADRAHRWVRRLGGSLFSQHDVLGTFHPNELGHAAIAQRVAPPLDTALGLKPAPAPALAPTHTEDESHSESIWTWIGLAALTVFVAAFGLLLKAGFDLGARIGFGLLAVALFVPALLLALLIGLVFVAVRLLRLLRPTWRRDPCPAPPARPVLHPSRRPTGTRQLLLLGGGVALLMVLAVLFAGVVGSAILWLRFWSSHLPADQSLDVVSRSEAVATGSQALGVFVALGLVAMGFAWLLDGKGQWVRSTRRGLIAIGLVEVLIAILIGDFRQGRALLIFAGVVLAALLLHFLLDRALAPGSPFHSRRVAKSIFEAVGKWLRGFADRPRAAALRLWQALPLALLLLALIRSFAVDGPDRYLWVLAPILLAAILFILPGGMAARGVSRHQHDLESLEFPRIALALTGLLCIAVLIARDEAWLAAAVAVAAALGLFCLAIAAASGDRFAPYGLAVLISVPIFGAAAALLHGVDSPELQPVAAVLKSGKPVCGVYVGESEGKLWLGRVVLDERGDVNHPRAGAIFSIDSGQVATRLLGSLQPVARADARAVELREQLLDGHRRRRIASRSPTCSPPQPVTKVAQTWQRRLAERYQPELVVDREDGFWPIPVKTIFSMQNASGAICRQVAPGGDNCLRLTTQGQFPWNGGEGESLEYPASDTSVGEQHALMVEALGSADPDKTATEYFLVSGTPGEGRPITIQYWFFYAFNYQPLRGKIIQGGFHEGDWESVGVLLSAKTRRPRYFWMARHDKEGRALPWDDSALRTVGDHPVVYAALGSHADYESCGTQVRFVAKYHLVDDHPTCDSRRQLRLAPEVTPLTDLSRTSWQCWHGLFGHRHGGRTFEQVPYLVADAPRSPMWQQRFGGVVSEPCRGVPGPGRRDGPGEEVIGEGDGVPARLRAGAGHLDPLVDQCGDWESHPPPVGTYMVACDQEALDSYLGSGLENPGSAGVRIDSAGTGAPRVGETTLPAMRRDPQGAYLDNWWLSAATPTVVSVYATCPQNGGVVGARFPGVEVTPGRPLHVLDRGGEGGWRLRDENGTTVAKTSPFVFEVKGGELVERSPDRGKTVACGG